MDLETLGTAIKSKRQLKGISLNKMSKDLYQTRGRVNHLSKIEKGMVDISFSQLVLICGYLKIKLIKIK